MKRINLPPAPEPRKVFLWLLLLFIGMFIGRRSHAQSEQNFFKSHVVPAAFAFGAGMFEGVGDGLQFHYSKSDQFWNPSLSWRNKYRNHDPAQGMTFAGKYLVFTTDGWHLMKFGRNLCTFGMVVTNFRGKKKFKDLVVDALTYWAVNRVGFNLTYSLIK